MTCPETIAIGAYVLGALDTAERRATEEHLSTCESCREALLQFAPLPGLLHAVPLDDIQAEEEPEPTPPLQLPVRRTPRRTLLAAAASVILAVAGLIGWQVLDDAPQASVTWTATKGIDVAAKLTSQPWGTDIQLRMAELRPGESCSLIVHGADGTTETAGWWATTSTYQADVPASTSIPFRDIDRLEVVTASGTVLSTLTPESR
ncbi:putative zinc finger protein [Kribbella steppae]|uniref:Putative zinc finger protein n=1 Tax=Kribbella steppae TaxID=2512223 RepID=A0A4R2HZ34_9ACTN|nr:zf-HC2 domain-containing protein [Kribbella steppae]TCO35908.1 putative zinc finger protein [Kribbella steppae]